MRILTVQQPWASLIIHGGKNIENRTWMTTYRGELAILAGKAVDESYPALQAMFLAFGHREPTTLPRRCIIGIVQLVDCVDKSPSPWFSGPWGFVLENPRALREPIEWRGQLGLPNASIHERNRIKEAMA